jgi:hypothetical protein
MLTMQSRHTLQWLKTMLGKRLRFFVAVERSELGASWPCGCVARGRTFSELLLQPCGEHDLSEA